MERNNIIISIFGKKGTGKSYLVKNKIIKRFKRIVIFDTQNEYDLAESEFLGNNAICNNVNDFIFILKYLYDEEKFKIICKFQEIDEITIALNLIYELGKISVVIEEGHLLENRKKDILYKIYTTGRHKNINLISTSQRFASVSRELTSQSDIIISFRQTEKIDLNVIKFYTDEWESIKELKNHRYKVIEGTELFNSLFKNCAK